jgi:hypothetical protein
MKKISFLLLVITLLSSNVIVQAQNFNWVKKFGGTSTDYGFAVEKDNNGNTIVAGSYSGTIDIDPGLANFNVTSAGAQDIYIVKLDSTGNFLWGKSVGGPNIDNISDLKIDNSNNIYLSGYFRGSADFDPSTTTFTLSTASGGSSADGFLLKLDANGNFNYAKQIGGTSAVDDHVISLDLDVQNNIYLTGYFNGSCDLDPGTTQFLVNSVGGSDIFVVKLNSSGSFIFGKTIAGTIGNIVSGGSKGFSIKVNSGNIIVVGEFDGTQDFDTGSGTLNLTSNGLLDIFILKLDLSGNFVFAKSIGGTGNDIGNSIQIDQSSNLYISGFFNNTVDFNPSTGVNNLISNGSSDGYLLKLDNSGGYLYCKQIGGIGTDNCGKTSIDNNDNIFVTGSFSNSVDFDNSTNQLLLNSNGLKDIFVAAYSSNGTIIYAQNYGSTSDDDGIRVKSSNNKVYVTGHFQNTVDFDFGTNTANLTSSGSQDAFLLTLNNSFCTQTIYNTVTVYDTVIVNISVTDTLIINTTVSSVTPPNNINTFKVFPNPASTHITIDYGNFALVSGYQLRIVNSLSQSVFQTNINQQSDYLDLSTWGGNGMYFVHIIDPQGNIVDIKKIVLQ